jgi:predicted metalloprotease with PDZ domain
LVITYRVTMPMPQSHLFWVDLTIDDVDSGEVLLRLPAWTPGSYLVRDFARHVERFSVSGDAVWRKVDKAGWQISTVGSGTLQVRYAVYANELTVRTSHLDTTHGYFNGANLLMAVEGRSGSPLRLEVLPYDGWQVSCALAPAAAAADGAAAFLAADYDELVDAPVECGTQRILRFVVDGIPHEIALWGEGNYDAERLIRDHQRIVETQRDMFGGLPYRNYLFIVHLTDGRGGGLEHRNSVTNAVDRWAFGNEAAYRRYLGLTSHELFHVWNVKRIRPAPLGPFDYQRENYTRLLWLMEGATSYYDDLLLVRAGLLTAEQFLSNLAETIVEVQSRPGRQIQSLEASSFDAWIKFYRPDEHSANSSISYYSKGALVCLAFDSALRQLSAGRCSLDDVMRELYRRYPISGPGIPEDGAVTALMRELLGPVDGADTIDRLYREYVAGTVELDYAAIFAPFGLSPRWSHRHARRDGSAPGWIGANLRRSGERVMVEAVRSDGPAHADGLAAGDQILALNGWRVDDQQLAERVAALNVGAIAELTVFRGDRLHKVAVSVAAAPYDRLELVADDQRPAQTTARQAWLVLPGTAEVL